MPPPAVHFISRARNFQVTLQTAGIPMKDGNGTVVDRTRGSQVRFTNGQFACTDAEAKKIGYRSGKDLAEALRGAWSYKREFWEPGAEPGAVYPTIEDRLADIMSALARQQHDRLAEILAEEEATHDRPEVIVSVKRALGELGDTDLGRRAPGRPAQPKAA